MPLLQAASVLFPTVDQDRVEPDDYGEWERLISSLVKHYRNRGAGIRYWEVANEPDIGESGGCPYRFKPESLRPLLPAHGRGHPPRRSRGTRGRPGPGRMCGHRFSPRS